MIDNISDLHVTHIDPTTFPTPIWTFNFHNIFCVSNIKNNIISIYQFYNINDLSLEFLPIAFHVKDLSMEKSFWQETLKMDL